MLALKISGRPNSHTTTRTQVNKAPIYVCRDICTAAYPILGCRCQNYIKSAVPATHDDSQFLDTTWRSPRTCYDSLRIYPPSDFTELSSGKGPRQQQKPRHQHCLSFQTLATTIYRHSACGYLSLWQGLALASQHENLKMCTWEMKTYQRMCVCDFVYMHTHECICIWICIVCCILHIAYCIVHSAYCILHIAYVYVYVYVYYLYQYMICICICISVLHVCMHACMHMHVYMYVYTHIYPYLSIPINT